MFFRRTTPKIDPVEGDVFQRRLEHDLIETARVKAVTTGPMGIRHVRFDVSLQGLDELKDQRILAADIFSEMYQPA